MVRKHITFCDKEYLLYYWYYDLYCDSGPAEYYFVMSWSHVMDLTGSEQFQIITDPAPRGWLSYQSPDYLTFRIISDFWINILNQPFESTFWINLRNQPSHWIGGAISLWYVASSKTYVLRIVLLLTEVRMIQVVDLLADHPLVEACSVPPLNTPWWRCGWKPCWTQLGLLPCVDVSFIFRKVKVSDENDEGLFGSRPVASRPNEVRRPGPDFIRCRDLCKCTSGIMRRIWTVRMYQDDASDKASRPLGIVAEVEVEVGSWGTQ